MAAADSGAFTTRIACIGAGYVGGPTMAMIASKCPHIKVTVLDISKPQIDKWNSETLPIYEPGLDDLVKGVRGKNLFFSTDIDTEIAAAEIIFVFTGQDRVPCTLPFYSTILYYRLTIAPSPTP